MCNSSGPARVSCATSKSSSCNFVLLSVAKRCKARGLNDLLPCMPWSCHPCIRKTGVTRISLRGERHNHGHWSAELEMALSSQPPCFPPRQPEKGRIATQLVPAHRRRMTSLRSGSWLPVEALEASIAMTGYPALGLLLCGHPLFLNIPFDLARHAASTPTYAVPACPVKTTHAFPRSQPLAGGVVRRKGGPRARRTGGEGRPNLGDAFTDIKTSGTGHPT